MADSRPPVVIDVEPETKSSGYQEKKSSYIKDSASRIQTIAQTYGLDALLQKDPPAKNALERAVFREEQRKEQRQKNLEQILKLAHVSCKDETAGEPDQDWLYRFFDMAQEIHNSAMQKTVGTGTKTRSDQSRFNVDESAESATRHDAEGSAHTATRRLACLQLWW